MLHALLEEITPSGDDTAGFHNREIAGSGGKLFAIGKSFPDPTRERLPKNGRTSSQKSLGVSFFEENEAVPTHLGAPSFQ